MKIISIIVFSFSFLLLTTKPICAIVNPLDVGNNKFGIHIADPKHIEGAAKLINSNGGDWGYVTIVIRENERDIKRWQKVFDELRKLHLIPIVRIATTQEENGWKKFEHNDINNWVYFLNSLNWVVQNRYVIVGNEPNHATEWGGDINAGEYSQFLKSISQKLKQSSDDFFILPAGLDASAPTDKKHLSEKVFLREMTNTTPEIFNYIDGWVSHSYPNPEFSGSEYNTGRGTITTYRWEKALLRELGLNRDLPVFITETGWKHNINGESNNLLDPKDLGSKFVYAYNNVWVDKDIVAVTPFLYSYLEAPFDAFSWIDKDGRPYQFHNELKYIKKMKGAPVQIDKGEIVFALVPKYVKRGAIFKGFSLIKNEGQSIWTPDDLRLNLSRNNQVVDSFPISDDILPNEIAYVVFMSSVSVDEEHFSANFQLARNDKPFGNKYKVSIEGVEEPSSFLDHVKLQWANIHFWIISKYENVIHFW